MRHGRGSSRTVLLASHTIQRGPVAGKPLSSAVAWDRNNTLYTSRLDLPSTVGNIFPQAAKSKVPNIRMG